MLPTPDQMWTAADPLALGGDAYEVVRFVFARRVVARGWRGPACWRCAITGGWSAVACTSQGSARRRRPITRTSRPAARFASPATPRRTGRYHAPAVEYDVRPPVPVPPPSRLLRPTRGCQR